MSSNTKRIAKNTLLLYFRQILIMLVSLYTIRIVLNALGVIDFGIYNIVFGFVIMFSFFNEGMTNATQRFLNFHMGENDYDQVRNVFNLSVIIHLLIAVIFIILSETLGLYLFYSFLNIPADRIDAAFIVFQFTIATTVINIFQVPFKAVIIAYEKMTIFAILGIIEAVLKLSIAFLITILLFDKLIIYTVLLFFITVILFFIIIIYCNIKFETVKFKKYNNNELFKKMVNFSFWNLFIDFASICRSHGINVLINIFHGVTVNAAMGIASKINSAVYTFVTNFQTAFKPQIIKLYASKENDNFIRLIFQTSKMSFYLLFLFVLPLFLNADFVLKLWLNIVPEYSIVFTKLILIISLEGALSGPFYNSIQATGNIKNHQIILSIFIFLNLPLALLFLYIGFDPVWVLYTKIFMFYTSFIWRLFYINKIIYFSIKNYLKEVIIPVLLIVFISAITTFYLQSFFHDWMKLIISCITSTISIIVLVYFIGINKQERIAFNNFLKTKIKGVKTIA